MTLLGGYIDSARATVTTVSFRTPPSFDWSAFVTVLEIIPSTYKTTAGLVLFQLVTETHSGLIYMLGRSDILLFINIINIKSCVYEATSECWAGVEKR